MQSGLIVTVVDKGSQCSVQVNDDKKVVFSHDICPVRSKVLDHGFNHLIGVFIGSDF